MLWRQPLFAVPMALFFGTVYGGGPGGYLKAYQMSLVFAYSIGVLMWALKYFVLPRLPTPPGESHAAGVLRVSLIYTVTSVLGAALGAYLLHVTIMPGFLGSSRTVSPGDWTMASGRRPSAARTSACEGEWISSMP